MDPEERRASRARQDEMVRRILAADRKRLAIDVGLIIVSFALAAWTIIRLI